MGETGSFIRIEKEIPLEEELERLKLVTAIYDQHGYLNDIVKIEYPEEELYRLLEKPLESARQVLSPEFSQEGIVIETEKGDLVYLDPYNWFSYPLTYKNKNGQVSASARLIRKTNEFSLPTLKIPLYDYKATREAQLELSQLAVNPNLSNDPYSILHLFRHGYAKTKELKLPPFWLATIDNRVLQYFRRKYGFKLPNIGPTQNYLGSDSTPIIIDITKELEDLPNQTIAQFIRGE